MGEKIFGMEDVGLTWINVVPFKELPETVGSVRWEEIEGGNDHQLGPYRLYQLKAGKPNVDFKRGISRDKVMFDEEPELGKGNYADWFEKESLDIKEEVLNKTETQVFGNQLGTQMNGRLVKMCLICGSLVADTLVHIRFHNSRIKNG